eukprot:TRINITY_DN319_c0_g3_i11.p1 TRINITY_DN319_c0_g3~~TRINITY_DN319_c0_g3_i11.p1  ORF type:complete len:164 (-),score=25.76 TRINITY_DN319_c0_g3_i11:232-723(-)
MAYPGGGYGGGYPGQPGGYGGGGYPPQPAYGQPGAYGAQPAYGGVSAYGGGGYGGGSWVPGGAYVRPNITWNTPIDPRQPIIMPYGLDPSLHAKVYRASQAFRHFDKDWSGFLSHHEFKKAVHHLGHGYDDYHVDQLFYSLSNGTGRVYEQQFIEWYLVTPHY